MAKKDNSSSSVLLTYAGAAISVALPGRSRLKMSAIIVVSMITSAGVMTTYLFII